MDAIDYNFAHSLSCFVGTSRTGVVLESRDAVLTNSGAPVAEFNQGFLKRPDYKLDRALARVFRFYEESSVPFRLQFGDGQAAVAPEVEARGFIPADPVPVMLLSPIRALTATADGLSIRRVADASGLAHFQETAFESFGYPVSLAPVALTDDLMRLPHVMLFVGYVDEKPACCSLLLVTGETAGIYWVGSLDRHRRRGFGAAVTAHAVNAGVAVGCRSATLQASRLGEPVYRRLGFKTDRRYLRFDFAS